MRDHSQLLVEQALLVSEELIRVAILWHELWHEGLEEASRLFFGDHNIEGMLAILEPLHQMMDGVPMTFQEKAFDHAYGRELREAHAWCQKYRQQRALLTARATLNSGSSAQQAQVQGQHNTKELTQAWDIYYHVFRRITKQLPQLISLELEYVSPRLVSICADVANNGGNGGLSSLDLAVPGTYSPNQPLVRIHRVQSRINVITSKQRPRKCSIIGDNGQEYIFLLKGHEDLRQDERVMQLFGLVNSLLNSDNRTLRRNCTIQRFSVIPLSTNSGLIGWVPNCDTLHSLIRDYRDKNNILLNIEHRIMLKMAPDFDHLTLMQKVEVFEHALENTTGDDLAKILWFKSQSSDVWFDRRMNYTRSLAVMSMVGYILGLGDRHPSNLMLDRLSGKITHIDFGDCFEVAMIREKYPERIPFRLTRMLINAMEVTGIDGTYRITCNNVMHVLRHHKDSVIAVLEAFVYDPLLNWRLLDANKEKRSKGRNDLSNNEDLLSEDGPKGGTDPIGRSNEPFKNLMNSKTEPGAEINKKALTIVNRVRDKLSGLDFNNEHPLDVKQQVDLLIDLATCHQNLCQCYIGWCPFW